MQLKSIKNASELPFKGIELVKVDGSISEVIIGGKLRIQAGAYGGMKVLTESAGEAGKRYRVTAALEGFPTAVEYFDASYEADERVRHFEKLNAEVQRDHVDVLIGEDGAISEGVLPSPVAADFEAIPF